MEEGVKTMQTDEEKKAAAANPQVWRVGRTTGELGRKIVVLMRSCEKVAPPEVKDDRVPIWIGDCKLANDVDGSALHVYDAVFHPQVQQRAKGSDDHSKKYCRAVTALALDSIAGAHGIVVNIRDFKLVKKKDNQMCIDLPFTWETNGGAYYEKDDKERIENDKGVFGSSPLLSQLSDVRSGKPQKKGQAPPQKFGEKEPEPQILGLGTEPVRPSGAKPLISVISETVSSVKEPNYSLEQRLEDGVKKSELVIHLPGVKSVGEVDLEVGVDEVSVCVEEMYELILDSEHWSYPIDEDDLQASFDKASCQLKLVLTHA